MKKILVILDGIVAKKLLHRIVESNTGENYYDVIYINDQIMPAKKPSNFTFYKFDPTSFSKLGMILDKNVHTEALIALNSKDEMLNVIENIKRKKANMQMNVLDYWGIDLKDPYVNIYKGIDVLANGMIERLPNIPVVAQNIGLRQGEIMEIRIPFGSSYAYRYIGSIEQVEWKIFGLYRNDRLIAVKPSLILKPNDVILVIGKPKVLMQVYNAMSKNEGQFPMPFGHNIYLYLDLVAQKEYEVIKAVKEAKFLHERLKNRALIVKVTRPTNVHIMNAIKEELFDVEDVILEIDYHSLGFKRIISMDVKKYDVGMFMLSYELFKDKVQMRELITLRIPILKLGLDKIEKIKETVVVLDDKKSYEQISPIVFDISTQIKTKTKLFNLDPIGDEEEDKTDILDHFENLAKIFNQKIQIVNDEKNPIRVLKEQRDILQILPLKQSMFKKRYFYEFFYTNSDLLAFDLSRFNQLLIPIIED
ncbi:COG3400 family protein [Candidatus Marinarcus aquaticus]|uniref:Potassium transporter TrkA n=1 Tax=Candidatus Marinarcus aquaticus TaxID=2044504 RepID=A0A4Q0XP71_9BACT|nr:TrkA C-terminal domain-containing protein [Candidatus Marinarcus aquaticus]RXJ56394.1 potassium transporter TrkA [Candidatus Marinarcus aquaticus]